MKTTFVLVVLIVLAAPAGLARAAYPQTITTTSPFVNLPRPSDDPRWAEAFSHWDRRDDTEEVERAVAVFEELSQEQPGRSEVWLWLARSYYLKGMRLRDEEQRGWMRKSRAAADRCLEIDPQNGFARYWRWCAMIFFHDFTEEDFAEIRDFGAKYSDLRELTVPADDPLWQNAMEHWDKRYDREESEKAIEIFTRLEKKYPDRIEPKLWICRVYYWMHYIGRTDDEKADWCFKAAEWGRKAVAMEPRNPAANYLTAAALGQYGSHSSFLNYVRYAMEIADRLTLVMEEDPNYFYGGVSQYFALAIARAGSLVSKTLPLVGFSEELIMKNTTFASHYEPRYLRNYYALGEMFLFMGKKEQARKMLEKVVTADPAALKNMEAENRVAQDLARKLLEENFGE